MCHRPDIVYVTTQAVYDDLIAVLDETGLYADCVGFDRHFDALIKTAEELGNEDQATHWRNIRDFGFRTACSPLSGIEINGKIEYWEGVRDEQIPEPEDIIRVYIGNPLNPPHEPEQDAISKESMKVINAAYLA